MSYKRYPDEFKIEAKPNNLIGDRAYNSDNLDEELHQGGIEMIAPDRRNRVKPSARRAAVDSAATSVAGWWKGSLPEFSGNIVSWYAVDITLSISSALCSSHPKLSS